MDIEISKVKNFIERQSREFARIIRPEQYIADCESLDLPLIVRYLQGRLRTILFFFVNESYWIGNDFGKTDLIYPLHDRVKPAIRHLFLDLKYIVNKLNANFKVFDEFTHKLDKLDDSTLTNREIAILIGTYYREFADIVPRLETTDSFEKTAKWVLEEHGYPSEDREFLSPLFELQRYSVKYLRGLVRGFYLHGSLATMDYIPYWSDLDTFMIVSKTTILDPERLLELRRRSIQSHSYLYQVDPHQLHGHLLVSEFDLDYYPESFFPSLLLNYSRSFFPDNEPVKFNLRDCRSERLAALWNDAVYYFMHKAIQRTTGWRDIMQSRERKLFFHRLLTLPLFYLQAKGTHVYKKDSFELARQDFPNDDWAVIQEITSIMEGWRYCYRANRYLKAIGSINPKLFMLLLNKYYDMKYHFVDGIFKSFHENYNRWLSSALSLSITAWQNASEGHGS